MKISNLQSVFCLVIFFLFPNHAWATDWKFLAQSVTGNLYYDKSSIKKVNDNIIMVLTKTVYNEYGKKNGFSILKIMGKNPDNPDMLNHEVISFEFDSVNEKYRVAAMSFCDKNGNVLHSLPKFIGKGEEIPPESFAERLKNKVYSVDKTSKKKKK
jgi:hypothetical protein